MTRTLLLLVVALALAGCGGATGGTTEESGGTTAPAASAGKPACAKATAHKHPNGGYKNENETLDPGKTYTLEFETSCGAFTIALDQKQSPHAAASLWSLAKRGFFNDTFFHRIVPGFVIQGGDPTGTGTGGPGYSTQDAVPPDAAYTHGVVAMAKTQLEPSGTAGSQFFVVLGPDVGLPPDYAIVGKVTKGLNVVDEIGKHGDPNQNPTIPIVIDKVRTESS